MRITPIRSKEALSAAVSADVDPSARWYLMRQAKAYGMESIIPSEWSGGDHEPDWRLKAVPPEESTGEYVTAQELLQYAGSYSADGRSLIDTTSLLSSAVARQIGTQDLVKIEQEFIAGVDQMRCARLLSDNEFETLVASVRRVRTPQGAKQFDQPIGSVIKPGTKLPKAPKATINGGKSITSPAKSDTMNTMNISTAPTETHTSDKNRATKLAAPTVFTDDAKTVDAVKPRKKPAPKAAAKPAPATPPKPATTTSTTTGADVSSFTDGKQITYGAINPKAKRGDADHLVPKVSLADGTRPVRGQKVVSSDGRTGEIVETYQAYASVRWDDTNRAKTVKNDTLNIRS